MATNKYDEYFVKEPVGKRGGFFPVVFTNGAKDYGGAEFSLRIHYIAEPGILIKEPHSHDFDQFYFFLGNDMANPSDFRAEVEFALGAELETHLITTAMTVHVPKGMVHGPLNFKRVDKPLIFIDALTSAQYTTR
jgi:hypothetical protein